MDVRGADMPEKVMQTYCMMVNLTPAEEADARQRLLGFLENKSEDEHTLTVEALKYLRGAKPTRTRRARS